MWGRLFRSHTKLIVFEVDDLVIAEQACRHDIEPPHGIVDQAKVERDAGEAVERARDRVEGIDGDGVQRSAVIVDLQRIQERAHSIREGGMIERIGGGAKPEIQCSNEGIRCSGAIGHIGVDGRGIAITDKDGVDLVVAGGPVEQYGRCDVPIGVTVIGDVSRAQAGVLDEPALAVIGEFVGLVDVVCRVGVGGRRGSGACDGKDGRPGFYSRCAADGIVFELGELGYVARAIVGKRIHHARPGRIGCGGREVKNRGIRIAGFTGFTTGCSKDDDKYRGAQ
jgi:hypothetical protein